jgi:hypothetical protein
MGNTEKQQPRNVKLPIHGVMPSTFIAEDENNKMILIVAEDEEAAELKLRKQGIETYMLRYMIKPDKIVY